MRLATYTLLSALLTCATVWYAYQTRLHFYPMVIFLATSKFAVLILGNMALCAALASARMVKRLFLGELRAAEVEVVYEQGRYTVTGTLFALAQPIASGAAVLTEHLTHRNE